MNDRLCIGLYKPNTSWDLILRNLGYWFEVIEPGTPIDSSSYALIILNDQIQNEHDINIRDYLKNGGSVLVSGESNAFSDYFSRKFVNEKLVVNDYEEEIFAHIPFIDLDRGFYAVHSPDSFFNGLGSYIEPDNTTGAMGYMGLKPSETIFEMGYRRKRFFNPEGNPPDEIVSSASKHAVLEFIDAFIRLLHFKVGKPVVKKWISPSRRIPFIFRVDSDFSSREKIDELKELADKYEIPLTWFLHVNAHESWLDHFKDFDPHEIALHGYLHGYSHSQTKTFENIEQGYLMLQKESLQPAGFCAPYGIYNRAMQNSLGNFDFLYSSEFTFVYDGPPLQISQEHSDPLQIPVHPICTGSLNRVGADLSTMTAYFMAIIEQKKSRFEPIALYHHPMQPGITVIDEIFKRISLEHCKTITFKDFAEFWIKRNSTNFEAYWQGDRIVTKDPDSEYLYLFCQTDKDYFQLIHMSESLEIKESDEKKYYFGKTDKLDEKTIKHLRPSSFSHWKTNLIDWKNRIRL